MAPAWVLDILAAVMLIVAAVSAARLAVARPWQGGWGSGDTDVAHLLMAIAMAGMLVAGLRTQPDGGWEVLFGVLTWWFGYRVIADARGSGLRALSGGRCAPHWIHSAAMLYMFAALTGPGAGGRPGLSGMARSATPVLRYPALAFVLALILIGYSIWDLDQLSARRSSPARTGGAVAGRVLVLRPALTGISPAGSAGGPATAGGSVAVSLLSPGVTLGCRIAMGVTMAFMLLALSH